MNYWIFIVTSQKTIEGIFEAEKILKQRMEDGFWGLGEKTPHRRNLEKNDKVIFYIGNPKKEFAVSASLASKSFSLTNNQKENYSHGLQFYKPEYGVLLKDIKFLNPTRSIYNLISDLEFIENKQYWGIYFQGGVKQISEEDFQIIIGERIPIKGEIFNEELINDAEFALEMHLEDFLFQNWGNINWGSKLELFNKNNQNGKQFPVGNWYIDLLAIDTETNEIVVIELKKGKSSDSTVGQLLRYISWVKEHLAETNQNVRGIIISKEIDDALKYAVKGLPNIEVKTYEINFKLKDIS
ncbi:MAG: EVE domain-containing protein [Candidatus Heimdallarchaeota archaeon]|nr:EVE domain-containing protein [Candidatus Heimdallarchaeota archaeon]